MAAAVAAPELLFRASQMMRSAKSGLATAGDWYATMQEPIFTVRDELSGDLSIRRYRDSAPEMRQPALCDNLICLHQGGPKEVHRWHNGRKDIYAVELGALTIMPAKAANRWVTRGPIDFTHLMLSSDLIGRVALEEFDRDPSDTELVDSVGFRDSYLKHYFQNCCMRWTGASVSDGFIRRVY